MITSLFEMVDSLQIISAAVGFGPAVALLYYTLRDYTFPRVEKPFFDDRKVFAFLAFGIVLGMVIFAFEAWTGIITGYETLLVIFLGLAVMEELLKLVILNFPRFHKKVDTAFYGVSLGLGISATLAFAKVYSTALDVDDPTSADLVAFALSGLLLSTQIALLHGSTTTLIGIGVVRGDLKGYFSEALLIHIGYSLLMIPPAVLEDFPDPLALAGIALATAVVVYGYVKMRRLSLPLLIKDARKLQKK